MTLHERCPWCRTNPCHLDEAIAIGDFAATASMLEEPERSRIHDELIRHVRLRLYFGRVRIDAPGMQDVDRALYGSQNQVADTIIILLISFGLVSAFMVGRSGQKHRRLGSTITRITVYTVLVTAVFTVTMDLEQPHRGIMRNPQISLVDLLASLQ